MLMIFVFNHIFPLYFGKSFAKIIRHITNIRNFGYRKLSGNRLNVMIYYINLMFYSYAPNFQTNILALILNLRYE